MKHEQAQVFLAQLGKVREDLPYSPDLLRQLFDMTRDDSNASLEDVSKVLGRDQGLTAKVLVMANSAFYGLQAEVETVGRAVAILGLKEVRNIVLTLGLRALTRGKTPAKGFDLKRYWEHQFGVGLAARETARLLGGISMDTVFTAGLMHDLGKLMLAVYRPDDWIAIDTRCKQQDMTFAQAEDEYWGVDHAVVGSILLKSWGLPEVLCEAVNWHHAPELCEGYGTEARALCFADALVHRLQEGLTPASRPLEQLGEELGLPLETASSTVAQALEPEKVECFVRMVA